MGRSENRKWMKLAKKKGFDAKNPDFSVVTSHYESRYIKVITAQSSYIIDLQGKRAQRVPGDEASHLNNDSDWYEYDIIYSCSVSFPLRMTWKDGDRLIMRETTPIKEVIELSSEETSPYE